MLDNLISLVDRLGHWGYLIIFVIVALECQAFLGLAMPGESLLLAGGFFAGQGDLDLGGLIVVVSAAAILGDTVGYELGRYLGLDWLFRQGKRLGFRQGRLSQVQGFFERNSGKAVFASHFMHLMRSMMPFVAGSCRMPYLKFLVFNAAGCIVWATTFVLVGYFVGESWHVAAKWIGRASEIAGGALLLALALGWFWRWLVRHEAELRRYWQSIAADPRVLALWRRLAPQRKFFLERISPQGYLGLHLTAGVLLLLGAFWMFGGIAEDVVTGDPLTVTDQHIAEWLRRGATPGLTDTMRAISFFASPLWVTGVAATTGLVLGWKRCWYRLLALLIVIPGGMLQLPLLKMAFHRQRPNFEEIVLNFQGFSFPSGHTLAATLLYGLLAVFAVMAFSAWRQRARAILGACVMVLLVGFSRLYLGAHYLSDVLGAVACGLAWLALSLTAVDTLRRNRERKAK